MVTAMEIRHNKREIQLNFGLDRATRDALATYVRLRWPTNTAKMTAREFDLTLDEGRGIVAGKPSLSTIDKIWKRGGWEVLLPVMGAVIGQNAEDFLREQRKASLENARRTAGLCRDLRLGLGLLPDRGSGVGAEQPRLRGKHHG